MSSLESDNEGDINYWRRLIGEHPELANVVQQDPSSPFDELHYNNTILQLVVSGFYLLGYTPLIDVVKVLLNDRADPNIKNDKGETALHIICQRENRNPAVAKALVDAGADVDARTLGGERPEDFLDPIDTYSDAIRAIFEDARKKKRHT